LDADLRHLAAQAEAIHVKSTPRGDYYETAGPLVGPNGVRLRVKAFWMTV
jgi:hypothetical protein